MPGFLIGGKGNGVNAKVDVLRNYRWKIEYLKGPVTMSPEQLDMVLDANIPEMDFETMKMQGQSLDYKIPQKPVFPSMSISFYDMGGLQNFFEQWQDKMWNPVNGLYDGKAPTAIKGECQLELLNNIGVPMRQYRIIGMYPKKVTHSKLDMSNDSLKNIVAEFEYDYYKLVKDESNFQALASASEVSASDGPEAFDF
jgi:hypothetical protein